MSHDVAANGLDTWASKHGTTFQIGCHDLPYKSTLKTLCCWNLQVSTLTIGKLLMTVAFQLESICFQAEQC